MKIIPASAEDLARIEAAAAADGHPAFAPTHFFENSAGAVRGYFSAGGVTCVMFWSHTLNQPLESLRLVKESQRQARAMGRPVLYPCAPDSPFVPLLPDLGFEKIGNADFWLLKK
ncbi:MAG: hypothetical protein WDM76_09525 [Limisphaerales bacterium]